MSSPDSHFVCQTTRRYEGDWPLILGISKSVCRLQWDISFEVFVYFGYIGPKMPPIHLWPTQHLFFTREYTVEKFIEEHLSSQTGLLLAPCAWCEITNISLKTVWLLNRKCRVTETQIAVETDSYLLSFLGVYTYCSTMSFLVNLIITVWNAACNEPQTEALPEAE